MKHSLSGVPQIKEFEPNSTSVQEYQDEDYQPLYFIAESFDKAKEQLRIYSKTIKRPYKVKYDPFTQTIKIVDDFKMIQEVRKDFEINFDMIIESLKNIS